MPLSDTQKKKVVLNTVKAFHPTITGISFTTNFNTAFGEDGYAKHKYWTPISHILRSNESYLRGQPPLFEPCDTVDDMALVVIENSLN